MGDEKGWLRLRAGLCHLLLSSMVKPNFCRDLRGGQKDEASMVGSPTIDALYGRVRWPSYAWSCTG